MVRSERGVEWGTVLCPATERTGEYLGNTRSNSGRILRIATTKIAARDLKPQNAKNSISHRLLR